MTNRCSFPHKFVLVFLFLKSFLWKFTHQIMHKSCKKNFIFNFFKLIFRILFSKKFIITCERIVVMLWSRKTYCSKCKLAYYTHKSCCNLENCMLYHIIMMIMGVKLANVYWLIVVINELKVSFKWARFFCGGS